MTPFPHVTRCLSEWFHFPTEKIYCQVATVKDQQPHIRTMDLYDMTPEGNLILFTRTTTRKWEDLQYCSNMSICILLLNHGQIVVEGQALLKTAVTDFEFTHFCWTKYLDRYWQDFYRSCAQGETDGIPDSVGIILLQPVFWDIIEIIPSDFLKSTRKHYLKQENAWLMKEMPSE